MTRENHLPALFRLFRQYGYEGVSLSKIAATTELGKASLYHHFPGGKNEMVTAALAYYGFWMEENVFAALRLDEAPITRFEKMCDHLSELYGAGQAPCLLAALTVSTKQDIFHQQIKSHFQKLTGAIAQVLVAAGLEPPSAQKRAEDAAAAIQGALILSRGLDESAIFERAIARIPTDLCSDLDSPT